MSKDDYGTRTEWKAAMEEALKREGKRLFESGAGTMGGYYVREGSRAWCCAPYVSTASGSKGPQKTKAHLRSVGHFKEWCIEQKEKAIERFPEIKPLIAQYELLKGPRHPKDDIAQAVKENLKGAQTK